MVYDKCYNIKWNYKQLIEKKKVEIDILLELPVSIEEEIKKELLVKKVYYFY